MLGKWLIPKHSFYSVDNESSPPWHAQILVRKKKTNKQTNKNKNKNGECARAGIEPTTFPVILVYISYFHWQNGRAPLHYAAGNGHTHTCELLIQNNANVNQRGRVSIQMKTTVDILQCTLIRGQYTGTLFETGIWLSYMYVQTEMHCGICVNGMHSVSWQVT